jgi:hypothetical protein
MARVGGLVSSSKMLAAIGPVSSPAAQFERLRIGEGVRLRARDHTGIQRSGTIVSLGAAIVELPVRLRRIPSRPLYGREVRIQLRPSRSTNPPCPGGLFHVSFETGENPLFGPEAVASPAAPAPEHARTPEVIP